MEVFVLEVKYSYQGQEDVLYPVLLRNNSELLLVDCSYAGLKPLLQEATGRHSLSLADLTGILITHHDIDHMGGLQELKASYPGAKVYASVLEAPYISGWEKSLPLQQAEALYQALPEEQKLWARQFQEMLRAVQPVAVDVVLVENEVPASWGDIQIIPTQGHMPGHVSLYLPQSKTLLAADAVVVEQGELELANPNFTLDLEQAVASVKKATATGGGSPHLLPRRACKTDHREKLKRLVAKYTPAQPAQAPSD